MGGENDGAGAQAQVAGEPQAQVDQTAHAAVTAGLQGASTTGNGDVAMQAQKDYEAALAERDARIAELEGEIAEAAKTAEGAEKLRAEMDELRRRGDEERVGFELSSPGRATSRRPVRCSPITTTTSRSSRPPSLGCSARVRLRPCRLARRASPTRAPRLTRARR